MQLSILVCVCVCLCVCVCTQFYSTLEKTKIQQDKEYDLVRRTHTHTQTHTNTCTLAKRPCMLLCLQSIMSLRAHVCSRMCVGVMCQVVAHYDLLEEFRIKVPEMQLAAYQTLDSDYTSLRDAMWSGEKPRHTHTHTHTHRQTDRVL